MTSPASLRSGSRLTRKVPAWLLSRSTRIGLPVSMTCVHQRVRHHFLDALADEGFGAVEAQRRQELLVALADPDDAVLAVDQHRAHRRAGEHVEHALRRQLEHLVVGQRGDNRWADALVGTSTGGAAESDDTGGGCPFSACVGHERAHAALHIDRRQTHNRPARPRGGFRCSMNCAWPRPGSAPTTSCAAWSSAASGCCPSAARPTAWPSRAS